MTPFQWISLLAVTIAQSAVIIVATSVVFDAIHWFMHRAMRARWRLLRAIGSLHAAHHHFLDQGLRTNPAYATRNIVLHHVPELGVQLAVSAAFFLFLEPAPVLLAQGALVAAFIVVTVGLRGRDANHRPPAVLAAPRAGLWVGPSYHMLHHVHPTSYFSSYVTLFDRIAGTGCQIEGRRIVMTGASGAFGAPLRVLLERAGATVVPLRFAADWSYARACDPLRGDAELDDVLAGADILVLAHGSKTRDTMSANCTSFVGFIERFKRLTAGRRLPPEVWAVGSEIEAHPTFGVKELRAYKDSKCAYARHGRRYFHDAQLIYRHIVPSAFTSPMGRGLMSGRTAARIAFMAITRGLRYVPVTYTGIALLNFPSYALGIGRAEAPMCAVDRSRSKRTWRVRRGASPSKASMIVGVMMMLHAPARSGVSEPMPIRVAVDLVGASVAHVVQTWFSEDFANAAVPASGLKWRRLLEDRVDAKGLRHRRVRMEPAVDLPGPLQALVANQPLEYDEVSTWDAKSGVLAFAMESDANERLRYVGNMRFVETAQGARIIFQARVQVDAPLGMGGLVEAMVESGVKDGFTKLGAFLQSYLDAHPQPRASSTTATLAARDGRR